MNQTVLNTFLASLSLLFIHNFYMIIYEEIPLQYESLYRGALAVLIKLV